MALSTSNLLTIKKTGGFAWPSTNSEKCNFIFGVITLNLHVMYMIMSHWIKRKTVNSPPKEKMTSGSTEAERKLPSDEVALRFPPRRLNRMVKQSMAAGYWIPVPSAVDVRVPVQNKLTTHFYIRRKTGWIQYQSFISRGHHQFLIIRILPPLIVCLVTGR